MEEEKKSKTFEGGFAKVDSILEKYEYNEQVRNKKRKELKIPTNRRVIINIGRLEEQKNQLKRLLGFVWII